jgi:hypothetical protein
MNSATNFEDRASSRRKSNYNNTHRLRRVDTVTPISGQCTHRSTIHASDPPARAEYILPPNSEGRVASLCTRITPASLKSWRSLSKPTGYGPHIFGLDRSYSTTGKRSVTDRSLLNNTCCSRMKCRVFAMRIPSTDGRRRRGPPISPSVLRTSTP